ncbi:MAG: sugar phosphate nucleotidyltransferase [Chloroflexota bacterium]|nr:sugar phosphate nucleotidyltransferase [Chloroflexota bacterium]
MTKPLKIVIPMAGFGTRLRPLTWSKPKPLVPLAGGTVLDHVLDMFRSAPNFDSAEFVFILGPTMGNQIRDYMSAHYPDRHVDYAVQPEMIGQSDAFWQAREFLHGPMLMAFSDTLIEKDFSFLANEKKDGVAVVKPVPDPRRFGVAEVDGSGAVKRLIEKPQELNNNLALVGCYFFKEAEDLIAAIEEQMNRNISLKGEYFLVDAINILLERGFQMRIERVDVWLDAGTIDALMETNRYLLKHGRDNSDRLSHLKDTVILPPVNIHPDAEVTTSTLGPHVSIGAGTVVLGSTLKDAIIGLVTHITASNLDTSIVGDNVIIKGQTGQFILGDNAQVTQ